MSSVEMLVISELGFPKTSVVSLKQRLVLTTLRNVRSQGHCYVEVRDDGKKMVFFCTLCLATCHSDTVLFDHLKGKLHNERLVTAKATLMKQNPWPFSDGVFFFHEKSEEENGSLSGLDSKKDRLLENHVMDEDNLAIVSYEGLGLNGDTCTSQEIVGRANGNDVPSDMNLNGGENSSVLVIPAVLQNNTVSDLVVSPMGVGLIGARFVMKGGVSDEIHKIWCEWLGNINVDSEDIDVVPEHDFGIVTFAYNINLGRMGILDGFKLLLPFSPHSEIEDSESSKGKKRKSFSDPGDISNRYESSGEESQSSNSSSIKTFSGNDDQLVNTRIVSSKTLRKELREQKRVASERLCAICQQKMLPQKDVAALLNRKTGKLVCSSRNFTGAFHVYHVSCLVHWVLLCEVEIRANKSVAPKPKRRSKRKTNRKTGGAVEKRKMEEKKEISSAFCPECQGTGITTNGEELEIPSIPLSEIYRCKIKLCDAHKAWMKSPEVMERCSMGFSFPRQSDEIVEENVASLKLLPFYRANV